MSSNLVFPVTSLSSGPDVFICLRNTEKHVSLLCTIVALFLLAPHQHVGSIEHVCSGKHHGKATTSQADSEGVSTSLPILMASLTCLFSRRSFGPRSRLFPSCAEARHSISITAGGEWDLENEAIPATPLTGLSEDEARGYFDTSSADTSEDDNPPTILTAKRQTFRASTWIDSYGAEPSPTRERAMEEIRHEVHHPSLPIKKVEPVVDPSRFSIDSWVAGQDRKPTPVAKSFMSSEPLPRPARSSSSRRTSMVKQSPSRPTSARKTSSSSRPGSRPNSGHKQSDSISEAIVRKLFYSSNAERCSRRVQALPATMLFPTTPTRSSFKTKSSQPPKSPVLSPTVHPIKDSDLPPLPTSRTSLPSPPANLRELRLSSGSSRKPASRSHSRRGSRETRSVQHSRAPSEVTSISTVAQSLQIPAEVYINRDSPSPHSLARKNSSSSLQQ